ncbi:TonB-dependent receptor [Neolewinella antarctica]|uniref:TonB-dependent receptor n=1 Tax=Neolewinella antarctica TaxID=442734 RepID=A0ABX0X6L0_9BACT|nr:TonB-dependent receptor [Neolewinella antarctica]NJC24836.1 hypothetical protein [Neolewinella antarctica]
MLRFTLLLGGLVLFGSATAQTGIDNSNVTVVSTFNARLSDAERVKVTPTPPVPDTVIQRQQYLVNDRPISIEYPAPVIRPRGIAKEKAPDAKNGFASIGVGIPNALYADLSYDMSGIDNAELGVFARHHSLNNDGNVENQKSSDTEFGARGTYLFDQGYAVSGGIGYETQSRYYYGYNFSPVAEGEEPLTFTDDDVRQRFNTFSLDAEIFNGTRTAADIDYTAGISMYLMDGDPAVRENNVDIHVGATKWIADDKPLDVKFRADFTSFKDTSTQNLTNFYLMPSFTTPIAGIYRLKVGVNLTTQEDDFDVFPNVSVHAPFVNGTLAGFLGWDGNLQNNSLRTLTDYNPWVDTRLRVKTAEYWRFYGGVDGQFSGINYRLEADYKNVDNLATYLLDRRQEIPKFDVVYDDATIVTLQASGTMNPLADLRVNGSVAQRFYSMENQEEPWHLPSFTLNVGAAYQFLEGRLTTGADFYVENGLPYQNANGDKDNLNGLFDLSLNADYSINDQFSGWLRVNNLLNNKRERFVQYPTIGTNLLVGVSAKF